MENILEFLISHWVLTGTFVLLLALLVQVGSGNVISGVQMLTAAECIQKVNNEHGIIIDIRKKAEFANGHIVNSFNIPNIELETEIKKLQKYKGKPIIMVCQVGKVVIKSANTLKSKKFENVFCLKGGIQAWVAAELPLVKL